MTNMRLPLMYNNITEDDVKVVTDFLSQRPIPILTNGKKVKEFEAAWSNWLGKRYSVFVNSGSSANFLTMLMIRMLCGKGEVITAPFGWVSDMGSILQSGLTPVFCDIKRETLGIDNEQVLSKITPNTKAVLVTHILGYNALTEQLCKYCSEHNIFLIEDVCESHGATLNDKKLGSFGDISNFSFYYAHHMTSIEGGMICTDDKEIYNVARSLRSHGMLKEMEDDSIKQMYLDQFSDLNKDFIFIAPSYNMRSTEINAVMALNQLKRLDDNVLIRKNNLNLFLNNLDSNKYYTKFDRTGNSNYAFTLLLNEPSFEFRDKVESVLRENGVEFRRGMSGGGNQLRQPYLRKTYGEEYKNYPNVDYVHHYGWYIGNYPELASKDIIWLTNLLNDIK